MQLISYQTKKNNFFYLAAILLAILVPISVLACKVSSPNSIPMPLFKNALNLWLYPISINWLLVFSLSTLPFWTLVFVESLFLYKREQVPSVDALFTAIYANTFALISGGIWTVIYLFADKDLGKSVISSGLMNASGIIAVCFWLMLRNFCKQTGCLVILRNWHFYQHIPLIAGITFWGWNILNFWLAGIVVSTPTSQYAIASIPAWIGTASIILNGFIFNLVAKGWIVACRLPKPNPTLTETVISMSVWSYPILAVAVFLKPPF